MELKPAGKSGKVKAQIGETMLLSRYVAEARRAAKDAENSAQRAETVLINKQDKLVSGVNIKTINDQNVLGSGNIVISGNGSSIFNGIHQRADLVRKTYFQRGGTGPDASLGDIVHIVGSHVPARCNCIHKGGVNILYLSLQGLFFFCVERSKQTAVMV